MLSLLSAANRSIEQMRDYWEWEGLFEVSLSLQTMQTNNSSTVTITVPWCKENRLEGATTNSSYACLCQLFCQMYANTHLRVTFYMWFFQTAVDSFPTAYKGGLNWHFKEQALPHKRFVLSVFLRHCYSWTMQSGGQWGGLGVPVSCWTVWMLCLFNSNVRRFNVRVFSYFFCKQETITQLVSFTGIYCWHH